MKYKILSGSALKLLAMLSMLVDHLATFLWEDSPDMLVPLFTYHAHTITPYVLCRMFGRLAFPIFAFLVVEGYLHTRSRKRYGLNLLLFALLSELPWNLVHTGGFFFLGKQNVLFTLFFGMLGMYLLDYYRERPGRRALAVLGLCVFAFFFHADYGYVGYGFILMLYVLRELRSVQAVVGACMLPSRWIAGLAFIPINLYNGRRGFIRGQVGKYLFYSFYPLHLLVIWLLQS